MDPVGPALASSMAGLQQAERQAVRDARKAQPESARDRFRRALDEADLSVAETESEGAVRAVAANADEDARQDHRENSGYAPRGREPASEDAPPRIDVNG